MQPYKQGWLYHNQCKRKAGCDTSVASVDNAMVIGTVVTNVWILVCWPQSCFFLIIARRCKPWRSVASDLPKVTLLGLNSGLLTPDATIFLPAPCPPLPAPWQHLPLPKAQTCPRQRAALIDFSFPLHGI